MQRMKHALNNATHRPHRLATQFEHLVPPASLGVPDNCIVARVTPWSTNGPAWTLQDDKCDAAFSCFPLLGSPIRALSPPQPHAFPSMAMPCRRSRRTTRTQQHLTRKREIQRKQAERLAPCFELQRNGLYLYLYICSLEYRRLMMCTVITRS